MTSPAPSIGRRLLQGTGASVCVLGLTGLITIGSIVGTIVVSRGGDGVAGADCAIVFGTAVHGQNLPGPGLLRRMQTAIRLYKQGAVSHLVLSGGKGDSLKASEAAVMHQMALAGEIPEQALSLEEKSHSTLENLRFSQPLISHCKSVIAISDDYHLARIKMLAQRVGITGLRTYPADTAPELTFELVSIGRETAAYLWYSFPFLGDIGSEETAE